MPKVTCSHTNRLENRHSILKSKRISSLIRINGISNSLHAETITSSYSPIQTPTNENAPPIYPSTPFTSPSPTYDVCEHEPPTFPDVKKDEDIKNNLANNNDSLLIENVELIFNKLKLPFRVGNYFITEVTDKSFNSDIHSCKAIDEKNNCEVVCKIIRREFERTFTQPYLKTCHENVAQIKELLIDRDLSLAFLIFDKNYGDLHNYIRTKKRLRELEAMNYFKQILSAVRHCHERGLSLRDLKLKRFAFMDEERRIIRLEGLEEANIIENENNMTSIDRADKIACPAYVCPELLTLEVGKPFYGQAADIWSCGVMMYTMILGKYPFNGQTPLQVFTSIRKGSFDIPDTVSSRAKCLIRNMMKRDPLKRWSIGKALHHPWFERITYANYDQDCKVPDRLNSETTINIKIKDDIDVSSRFFIEIDDCLVDIMN